MPRRSKKDILGTNKNTWKAGVYCRLSSDDGDIEVEVIEQTVIDGVTYLLVADVVGDEEEGDCYILKDVSSEGSEMAGYEVVPDDEADGIFDTFQTMLKDDIDLQK